MDAGSFNGDRVMQLLGWHVGGEATTDWPIGQEAILLAARSESGRQIERALDRRKIERIIRRGETWLKNTA